MTYRAEPRAELRAEVPATTSNLGPGFDCLGMALDWCNVFRCVPGGDGLRVQLQGEGAELLPAGPSNLVVQTMAAFCEAHGQRLPDDLELICEGHVPVSGGLGSSATATVGGALLACGLLGLPADAPEIRQRLVDFASEKEGHPDNAAPCVLGGLVVSAKTSAGIQSAQMAPPADLGCVLATPALAQSTAELRAALPDRVAMADAVFNLSHTGLLVAALSQGRLDLLQVAMNDRIHQHVRTAGIAGFAAVVEAAQGAGALATVLSGAGATVIAYVDRRAQVDDAVARAMVAAFAEAGLGSRGRAVLPRSHGATLSVRGAGSAVGSDDR